MSAAVVIPCGAGKLDHAAPARELYTGAQYRLGLAAGEQLAGQLGAQLLIVSALHGLVRPDQLLEPYDLRMGAPGSVTHTRLAAHLMRYGVTELHALTPKAYTAALERAAQLVPGATVQAYLAGTRGLLEQRSRLARIRRGELVAA